MRPLPARSAPASPALLAALQATGKLASLPLGDCLMRSMNTERPPPYLGHVAPPQREKGFWSKMKEALGA